MGLREAWWPLHCACGEWIGLCLLPEVYDPDQPVLVGVCPACGTSYWIKLFAVHPIDPNERTPSR